MNLRGLRVLVVGAGRSGLAAIRLLLWRSAIVTLSDRNVIEDREDVRELKSAGIAVESGGHKPETFLRQDLIVLSPGVRADLPEVKAAREAGVLVIPEIELGWMYLKGSVVGVTGSNGKTTTTALIAKLLSTAGFEAYVAGNIGVPLCSQVERSTPATIHVVELSSFQLETINRFRPAISVMLNVTPDHLDRHHTLEEYARAKGRIFENMTGDDFAVLNADDPICRDYAKSIKGNIRWFSTEKPVEAGAYIETGDIVYRPGASETGAGGWDQTAFGIEEIPLKGEHNVSNVLAAVCAAVLLGADLKAIRAGVRAFQAVEHRLEYVATLRGVEFYNDSKATNVDATIKALQAFPGNVHLILGGRDKGSDYRVLIPLLAEKTKQIFLIGEAAGKIAEQVGGTLPVTHSGTLERAVNDALREAAPGDTVLLAPACASFDQFKNYEERGRVFKEIVHRLDQSIPGPARAR